MDGKTSHGSTRISHRGRAYEVPATGATWWGVVSEDPWIEVDCRVDVRDGQPVFRSVTVVAHDGIAPIDLQRLPWARIVLYPIEASVPRDQEAVDTVRSGLRAAARRQREANGPAARRPVTDDRLREVLALREAATAAGARRYDVWVAKRMQTTPGYVRRLYSRAKRLSD